MTDEVSDTDRTIRVMCRKCWGWTRVSLPLKGVEDFCLGLRCVCGGSKFNVAGESLPLLLEMRDQ
jgi:hypothetical protein